MSKASSRLFLGGIVALGVLLRARGLMWGLHNADVSRRPQPDEWVVTWLSHWFTQYHSLNPCPHPGKQCFFDWGAVYPYLMYGIHQIVTPAMSLLPSHLFGPQANSEFIQAAVSGRVTSLIVSSLAILLAYKFGAIAYGRIAGLLAALLVALSTMLIQLSHFATPDSTTVLWMMAALVAALVSMEGNRLWLVLAGVLAGIATGTEYQMVLLLLPVTAAWWLSKQTDLSAAIPVRWLAGSVGACILTAGATNIYALIEPAAFVAASLHTLQIRTVDSAAEYQGRFDRYGPGILFVLRYPLGYGVGVAFTVWMVIGALFAILRRRRADLLLLAWIVPYFLLVSFSSAKFMRYSAPLIPPLAILAGRVAVDAFRWTTGSGFGPAANTAPRWRAGLWRSLIVLVAAVAVLYSWTYDMAYGGLFTGSEPRAEAAAWLSRSAPKHARIGFEMLPNGLVNMPYFIAAGLQPCFTRFQVRRLGGPMRYLVTDEYSLEDHHLWTNAQVLRFRHALATDPHYRVVAKFDPVPTFLGIDFPIAGSVHDWRYPAHVITIYRRSGSSGPGLAFCYPTLRAAQAALYSPTEPTT
ncbi:MAG: ArnT family glycosyltransferase [Chloroflexota bacterium]